MLLAKIVNYLKRNGFLALIKLFFACIGSFFQSRNLACKYGSDDRESILLVVHEASRTGAPILAFNIARFFVERYNVIVLILANGAIVNNFSNLGATVIVDPIIKFSPFLARLKIASLCKRHHFKFVLVNSIESRYVLQALNRFNLPTLSLIHEFLSYTRPKEAFTDAFFWSDEVIFSANITLDNLLDEYPEFSAKHPKVLPQGRCEVPSNVVSDNLIKKESARIRNLLRPKSNANEAFVILGAGYVQLRKGVDLFIECAAKIAGGPNGDNCRFVWVGKGYDPEGDVAYSVYLADQIKRSGLEGKVFFVGETQEINDVYQEADLFLLTSRLDPLPNVAIDALAEGLPVLCFDKTTGIAEFLKGVGLAEYCVAGYLDSDGMANNALRLLRDETLRNKISGQCRQAATEHFNMERYVNQLEMIAVDASNRLSQQKIDIQTILDSKLFRPDFVESPEFGGQSIEFAVLGYVRSWAAGVGCRKPFPGFHPGIYLEQHGVETAESDPFADYLRAGRPSGPWDCQVISANASTKISLPVNESVALHLHVYYLDLLPEIISKLSINKIRPYLFVSITDESDRDYVLKELAKYQGNVVDVRTMPNIGRDIGPFFTGFGQEAFLNYEYVGHIHTKKTVDIKNLAVGQTWYSFLLDNLLGKDSAMMADRILDRMKMDPSIGLVFPDDPNVIGWTKNKSFAKDVAEKMGLGELPTNFIFPIGSMFWARTDAIKPFFELNMDWSDYPKEPLPYDGTILHGIERLLGLVVASNGYQLATTNLIGVTR